MTADKGFGAPKPFPFLPFWLPLTFLPSSPGIFFLCTSFYLSCYPYGPFFPKGFNRTCRDKLLESGYAH